MKEKLPLNTIDLYQVVETLKNKQYTGSDSKVSYLLSAIYRDKVMYLL